MLKQVLLSCSALAFSARVWAAPGQSTLPPLATASSPGTVQPDGTTTVVNTAGLLSAVQPYVLVTSRPPKLTDDGTGLASSTGPCSITPAPYIWDYINPVTNQPTVYVATACPQGNAHWVIAPNPGLVLDAVPGGHGWATFKAANAASNSFHLTDGGSNSATIGFLSNGLANYAAADAFVAATPQPCSAIPDYVANVVNGHTYTSYCPAQAIIDIMYDQTNTGTAYNSVDTFGLFSGTVTTQSGSFSNNDTLSIGSLAGCNTQVLPAQMAVKVVGGVVQPISYSTGSSMTLMGECSNGTLSAAQTATDTVGGGTVTFGMVPYNEAPVWGAINGVGTNFRGAIYNSVVAQLGGQQLNYAKTTYVPNIPWTPSNSTIIMVFKLADGTMSNGGALYEAPALPQIIAATGTSAAIADAVTLFGALGGCALPVKSSASVLAVSWNTAGGGLSCQQDSRASSGTGNASSATTGLNFGGMSNPNIFGAHYVMAGFFIWTTPLTTAQIQTAMISLAYSGNLIKPVDTSVIVAAGDSTSAGSGDPSNATSVWAVAGEAAARPYNFFNGAIHGQDLAAGTISGTAHVCTGQAALTMECRATSGVALSGKWDPTLRETVAIVNGGQNDLRAGASPAMIEGGIQSIVTALHSYVSNNGTPAHIVFWGFPPSCDLTNGTTTLASMETLYYWEETNAFVPQANGGMGLTAGADVFVPMEADPVLSPGYLGPENGTQTGSVTIGATSFCQVPAVTTGTITSASNTVTGLTSAATAQMSIGQTVYPASGIPINSTITQVQAHAIVLSNPATANNSNETIIAGSSTSNLLPTIWSPDGVHEYLPYFQQWAAILEPSLNSILN